MLASSPAAQPAPGAIDPPLSPRNANYTIAARLDPARGPSPGRNDRLAQHHPTTATELQFHLYWNAWRDTRSTFMRERALGGATADAERAGRRLVEHRDLVASG